MYLYKYKNISLNYSLNEYADFTGDTILYLDSDFVSELIENSCSFYEFFIGFQMEELKDELEDNAELISKHFFELGEVVEVTNADAIISVYEYCLSNEENEYQFDVESENVSWIIHDILHAKHDAAGCTIYVESEVERQRIVESLEITQKEFPSLMPDFSFLENLESEFYSRFKENLDLEEFKYLEEYY